MPDNFTMPSDPATRQQEYKQMEAVKRGIYKYMFVSDQENRNW